MTEIEKSLLKTTKTITIIEITTTFLELKIKTTIKLINNLIMLSIVIKFLEEYLKRKNNILTK